MSLRAFALTMVVAGTLGLPAFSSAATVTLGPPGLGAAETFVGCENCQSYGLLNVALPTGNQLTAPADGTVIGWRVEASVSGGDVQLLLLRRKDEKTFSKVGTSAVGGSVSGELNAASLPIAAGDTIGLYGVKRCCPLEPGAHLLVGAAAAVGAGWTELDNIGASTVEPLPVFTGGQTVLYNATVDLFPPSVNTVSPSSGQAETSVAISGPHLAVAEGVTFGGAQAKIISADDDQVVALAPPNPQGGTVSVQVKTAGGTSAAGPGATFTYPTPLALSKLHLAPRAFRALPTGGSIASKAEGSRVTYRLSAAATTTFSVERRLVGRRVGKRCVAPSAGNRQAPKCHRFKVLKGHFARSGAVGLNRFIFSGRLRHRPLPPGSYRLVAVAAIVGGGSSEAVRAPFKILP